MAYKEVFLEGIVQLTPESGTMFDAGGVDSFTLSFSEDKKEVQNKRGGGGTLNGLSRVKNVTGTLKTSSWSKDNLAAALRAESSTALGITTIEALVNSGKTYSLKYLGTNAADQDKTFGVDVYKIKFSPMKSLSLIGDDFGTIELDFEVYIDTTKVGAGVSKYFKIEIED